MPGQAIDFVGCLRACFLLAACTILVINSSSLLRERLVTYGARATNGLVQANKASKATDTRVSRLDGFLAYIASWQVSHSYFTHFYIASVASSLFWGIQLLLRGRAFEILSSVVDVTHAEKSMSFNQICLCWALLAFQGCRRLYECITLSKPSNSKMWFTHWLLGLVYYIAMGVAIWIEGIGVLRFTDRPLGDVKFSYPSLKTAVGLPVFIFASGIQHDCHCYLASLKKYTLPMHPAFLSIISPHYTAECAIYLSLAFLAAPKGDIFNKTLLSGLIFVAVNLGVSAGISKTWYMQKFGKEQVQHKWKMIPLLY